MSGVLWEGSLDAGFTYSKKLSKTLRTDLQPLTKFRQLCDIEDGSELGINAGDKLYFDVYSDVATQGGRLTENVAMTESSFSVTQKALTVYEAGHSVPYTGKLEFLSLHKVADIIDKTLKNDARKYFDSEAFEAMKLTKLRAAPTSGNSATAVTLTINGATTVTNNLAMNLEHVKSIGDTMGERNIPPMVDDDYVAISHPTTVRQFRNDLESIYQYTEMGTARLFEGEIGRYENMRFIKQTNIPKGGANDSTTFDSLNRVADAWNNALSSWVMFCGADTVAEGIVCPEEIRAKIPTDYGRSKGIAWYYLGGFALVHDDAANGRIVMWDSAA